MLFFLLAEGDDLMMPEVPVHEAMTDSVMAFEEEPRDFKIDPESPLGMIFFSFFYRLLLTYIFYFLAS